jgi:hypothetical protein
VIEAVDAEPVETRFTYECEVGMPQPARTRLGVTSARTGGVVALAMPGDPSSYWSKALAFGLNLTLDVPDELIGFYRQAGVRQAVSQLLPPTLPAGFEMAAQDRGLERGSLTNMIKVGLAPLYEADNWIWRP